MYLPKHFEETRVEVLHGLIHAHPLGALVTLTAGGLDANHIPFEVDPEAMPFGTLREPLDELKRADIFVLTKCDIGSKNVHWIRQKLNALKPNAAIFEAIHKPLALTDPLNKRRMDLSSLQRRKMAALSGIGDPYSFEKTVEFLGAELVLSARYDDHHEFKASEILDFAKQCRGIGLREAVTTEKDYFRMASILEKHTHKELQGFTFWALEIEFQVADEENFVRRCLNS